MDTANFANAMKTIDLQKNFSATEAKCLIKLCGFPKQDGIPCGSPAMRTQEHCFFHAELARRKRRKTAKEQAQLARRNAQGMLLPFDSPQDRLMALTLIMRWLFKGIINDKEAGKLIHHIEYANHLAGRARRASRPTGIVQNLLTFRQHSSYSGASDVLSSSLKTILKPAGES
jgi:hypothetical protein